MANTFGFPHYSMSFKVHNFELSFIPWFKQEKLVFANRILGKRDQNCKNPSLPHECFDMLHTSLVFTHQKSLQVLQTVLKLT